MSAARVQDVCTGATSSSGNDLILTVDTGVTTTANNVVIIWCRSQSGRFATGVVDSRGNTWQLDTSGSHTQSNGMMASAVMGSSTFLRAGDTITVTFSGAASTGTAGGATEFTGLDITGGVTTVQTVNNAHDTSTPGSVTTTSAGGAGDLAVTCATPSGAGTLSITASDSSSGGTWTDLQVPTPSANTDAAYQVATGASAYTAAWAWPSGNAEMILTVYKVGSTNATVTGVAANVPVAGGVGSVTAIEKSACLELSGFGTFSENASGDTINSVTVEITEHQSVAGNPCL